MSKWFADTSVAVAALVASHETHEAVMARLARVRVTLPAHAALETYSVLTRLPGDARLVPADAATLVHDRFGAAVALSEQRSIGLVAEFARLDIAGAAVYDALIAATAIDAGATLLTRDRRAAATYLRLEAPHEFVE